MDKISSNCFYHAHNQPIPDQLDLPWTGSNKVEPFLLMIAYLSLLV